MKCKINIFSTLFAMIIAPLFFQSNANAQSDCSNAFAFSMDSVSQTYSINDSVLWMEFEADTNFVLFEVTTHDTNYVVEHITLYSGTCGSLQQLATSTSSSLSSANLVKNNLYKLKISLNGIYNGGIDIYNILLSCPTKAFIYANPKTICAGDSVYFENRSSGNNSNGYVFTWTFDGQAPNFSALINPNNCNPGTQNIQDFFITFNNPGVYIVYLYEWGHTLNYLWSIDSVIITVLDSSSFIPVYKKSYTCNENVCFSDISHNIKPLQNTGIGYINGISWTFYEINLNYFQTFYTNSGDTICIGKFQNGTYILQAYASGYCEDFDLLDTIEIVRDEPKPVIPSIACVGESVMMVDTSHCPLFWKWTFGDGSVGIGNDTIYHIYNQPGVYIVELQTDSGGTIVYKSIEIKKATKPLISGSFTTCDSTVLYTIENYDTNYIYTWSTQLYDPSTNQYSSGSFVINGSGTVVSADSALIDWYSSGFPYLPEYALVTVEAKLKGTNCSDISTFEVYQCCEGEPGSGYTLIYDSIFQGTTIINGGNFVVNGLITVTDTMIINSSALWMGPYAKIELDSGAYFKLDNSLIQAGCFFMWDGIYSDNQTESVILNNSTFYDAINGAISKNGAKLYSDSMRFINNYISLQVLDHKQNFFSFPPQSFTPADIRIRATNFNGKDGLYSVPNMLAPYQNDQPYTGIKIRNMQNIAVGDISTGSNFYKEMKNGIVIYNSSVSVVNNHFKLIESLYYSPNYDAAAITINAPAMNDMDNIGDVTIGNLNSYQNTFDSCYQSVYSNNSKVKIMKNIFKYGHQSVRIDNFKNGSLVSYNRFKDAEFGVRVQ
ncbi:MAG: hypothetical protein JXR34_12845, partial [Bacteroidales bacterium]|nr:hypothetical protein [Bacteroidales bacterium]